MTPSLGIGLAGLLGGCDGSGLGSGTGDTASAEAQVLREERDDVSSDRRAELEVEIEVEEGDTAFQVSLDGDGVYPVLQKLIGPDGVVLDSETQSRTENLTQAFYFSDETSALNWPVRLEDGPLTPGTWTAKWLSLRSSGFGQPGDFEQVVTIKRDPDPDAGEIAVRILWAKGVSDDDDVVAAVEEAVEHWRVIWADHGLTLVERYDESDLDPGLPFAYGGSGKVKDASEGKLQGELQLVVGETAGDDPYVFGVAGGIPGSVAETKNTFVVLAWLTHAGFDGRFDRDEIQLMGETMAHETGHYTGLFHPVEMNYSTWDALRDTPKCQSQGQCENQLAENVMFPYPLCTFRSCENQVVLTDDQVGVLQTFVGAK